MEVNIQYKNYPEELASASVEVTPTVIHTVQIIENSLPSGSASEKTLEIKLSDNTTGTTVDIVHSMNKEDLLDYIELLKKFASNIN